MFDLLQRFRSNRHAWDAHRAQAVPVRALVHGGYARVMGVIEGSPSPLVSPLLRRSCVGFGVRVDEKQWERKSEDDDVPWWKTEIEQWKSTPFSILDPEGARLFVDHRAVRFHVETLPRVNDAPEVNDDNPQFRAFMRANGMPTTLHMGIANEHRFCEWSLVPGAYVGIYGYASVSTEVGGSGYRDAATTRWMLSGSPEAPVRIYPL